MSDSPLKVYWDGYGLDRPESGVFYYAKQLSEALKLLDVHPTVISSKAYGHEFLGLKAQTLKGLPLVSSLGQSKPIWPLRVAKYLEKKDPAEKKILHGLSNINLPFLGRYKNLDLVVTIHDLIPLIDPKGVSQAYHQQFKFLLPKILQKADKVVCVSKWTRETLIERFPFSKSKCSVISNGMTPQQERNRAKAVSGSLRLLTISRFETYKRLELLMAILRRYGAKFTATLVTDQNGKNFFEKHGADLIGSGQLKVQSGLTRAEIFNLYKNSDIYVHPSLLEGFCLPAAEALAFGLPVAYQSGSGIDETVGEKVGHGLGQKASVDEWIQAIEHLFGRSLNEKFYAEISEHLTAKSSWKDAAKSLKFLYQQIH